MNINKCILLLFCWLSITACKQKTELMDKFQELDDSLEEFTTSTNNKNEKVIKQLDSTEVSPILIEKIHTFHKNAQRTIGFIESLKKQLIEQSQVANKAEDSLADIKNTNVAIQLFLGKDNKGTKEGLALERKLKTFTTSANDIYKEVKSSLDSTTVEAPYFHPLALSGKEDPQFRNSPEYSKKTFLELAFDHTPMIAALAFLTEKQSRIASYEKEILDLVQENQIKTYH